MDGGGGCVGVVLYGKQIYVKVNRVYLVELWLGQVLTEILTDKR